MAKEEKDMPEISSNEEVSANPEPRYVNCISCGAPNIDKHPEEGWYQCWCCGDLT